jgi:hypothetical protein
MGEHNNLFRAGREGDTKQITSFRCMQREKETTEGGRTIVVITPGLSSPPGLEFLAGFLWDGSSRVRVLPPEG